MIHCVLSLPVRDATPKYKGWALGSGDPKGRWSGLGCEAGWQVLCVLDAKAGFSWDRLCVCWSFLLGTVILPH